MKAANVRLHLFIAMLQGIETAGALIDQKPFKAKGQGRKRFSLALGRLFPTSYSIANNQLDLYGVLRSHSVHCMVPSHLVRLEDSAASHLVFNDSILTISLEQFYTDYCTAIESLLTRIQNDQIKRKRIPLTSIETLSLND